MTATRSTDWPALAPEGAGLISGRGIGAHEIAACGLRPKNLAKASQCAPQRGTMKPQTYRLGTRFAWSILILLTLAQGKLFAQQPTPSGQELPQNDPYHQQFPPQYAPQYSPGQPGGY